VKPLFSPGAERVLAEVEADLEREALCDAVWDTIDFVCQHPDSAQARRRALRTPAGHTVWLVPVPNRHRDNPWVLLWQPQGEVALIAYVGPDDFRPGGK
jgi:hypothetical protein